MCWGLFLLVYLFIHTFVLLLFVYLDIHLVSYSFIHLFILLDDHTPGSHQNCEHDFDGSGGEIAHSQQAGNMHFDDEENFKSIRSYAADGIYLLHVAVHEIGHVLGLAHTNRSQSIMYAIYRGALLSPEFELSREDRRKVQKIYGRLALLCFLHCLTLFVEREGWCS